MELRMTIKKKTFGKISMLPNLQLQIECTKEELCNNLSPIFNQTWQQYCHICNDSGPFSCSVTSYTK